jgi:UDP-glucose 4-epimerase
MRTNTVTPVAEVDNLSTGLDSRVLGLLITNHELPNASAGSALEQLIQEHKVSSIVHFAALKQVGESVEKLKKISSESLLAGQAELVRCP